MPSGRARHFVALRAAPEGHDRVAAQRILAEKVVQGGYQRPHERSILGEGFARHQHEPAMDSPPTPSERKHRLRRSVRGPEHTEDQKRAGALFLVTDIQ
jgi:hypothetical protein